ncbi:MAG: peptide-methionine (R)-S-oxide reductase MsrB [Candidatus Binatia bacterium]
MTRRTLLRSGLGAGLAALLPACRREPTPSRPAAPAFEPLQLSVEEWRRILTPEPFTVLRERGTERAFSSPLERQKSDGTYVCAGCFLPLFGAAAKFESGTGWPSFFAPIAADRVATAWDFTLVFPRTEYHCARCGGHQGHVFDDGPPPTGQRWCNNGVALRFVPDGTALPPLRT